jgi:hypothetical protein
MSCKLSCPCNSSGREVLPGPRDGVWSVRVSVPEEVEDRKALTLTLYVPWSRVPVWVKSGKLKEEGVGSAEGARVWKWHHCNQILHHRKAVGKRMLNTVNLLSSVRLFRLTMPHRHGLHRHRSQEGTSRCYSPL